MADSSVAVTAGSGTSIDTRTEGTNGNHRQVVVLGDPATNAGVAPVDATNGLAVDVKQSVTLNAQGPDAENAVASGNPVQAGGRYDATPRTLGDGDVGAIALDADGAVQISDGGNNISIDDGGNVISVDDGGGSLTVDGTVAVSGTVTVDLGANNDVQGDVAHDSADSGNPLKIGAKATNNIEGLTQVADADRTDLRADLNGVLITRPYTTPEEILSERVSDTGGTSTAFTTFGAGGAGIHNYVTTIVVHNASATDGYVDIRDGSAGSVLMTIPAPTTGGAVINLPVPLKSSANTALAYDVSGALTTVYITLVGYQAQG